MGARPMSMRRINLQAVSHCMRYDKTIDDSRQYLRLTLELIDLHDLPTNPLNCAIWYAYESGRSKPLDVAIDKQLENNGIFFSETSRGFSKSTLPTARNW
jgi:hypothetical protein